MSVLQLTSLRANKLRALLTMLGIIIGIGAVITIITIGDSLTGSFNEEMSKLGATISRSRCDRKAILFTTSRWRTAATSPWTAA